MSDKATINSIQALRGVAALLVVVLHTFVHLKARNIIDVIPEMVESGRVGVDIFFVISGFIMVYISGEKFSRPGAAIDFFVKRLIRIAPIYWFYTLIMAVFLFFLPNLFSHGKEFDVHNFIASMLFVPWNNNLGGIKPVLQVGWTLNFEMYFYMIFTLLLLFKKQYFLPLITLLLILGVVVGIFINTPAYLYVVTSPLLFEFLMGCYIGILYKSGRDFHPYLLFFLILTGASIIMLTGIFDFSEIDRVVKWGIPAAMILMGLVFYEKAKKITFKPFFLALGASSYSLYLTHIFTINAFGKIWAVFIGKWFFLFIPLAIFLSIIVGYLSYIFLEKNITSYLNKKFISRKV